MSQLRENNRVSAVIVTSSEPLREGLQGLLAALPQVHVIGMVGDVSASLGAVSEQPPDLVLLSADLSGGQEWQRFRQIRQAWPQTRFLVMASDAQQQQQAAVSGADAALLSGVKPAALLAIIQGILAGHVDKE